MSQSDTIQPEFWRAVEALHSVVYFADATSVEYPAIGLRGYWRGYFATRAAALGTPADELVTATFFGFAPDFVARAIPQVWELADRDEVLRAREEVATNAIMGALGAADVSPAAGVLFDLACGADLAGKPLAAAHRSLTPPDDPHGRLWWSATVLRELRGDCHIAVLVSEGLDGAAANVLAQAVGLVPDSQREHRGWTEEDWGTARERLRGRGWVAADGTATSTGTRAREQIERRTHVASNAAFSPADQKQAVAQTDHLVELSRPLETNGPLVYPNPTGVPRP